MIDTSIPQLVQLSTPCHGPNQNPQRNNQCPATQFETPYRSVDENGKVRLDSDPEYFAADEEENKVIAQANANMGGIGG